LRELAYKIKGCEAAYYYIYYFDCDDAKVINEFRRLSNLNADVLRILIINLEKTYGYSMVNNPKKIKQANLRYDNYSKKVAAFEAEFTKKRNSRLNVEDTSHIVDEEIIDTDE
jgi:hypothetical protein